MGEAVLIMAVLLPLLMAAAFLLGRHLTRRRDFVGQLSAVTRQHIELFQGGQLNETAVESTKARFRELLERGEVAAVEASLRPGTLFVVQVRALAELGTDEAGRILERQLQRRLTSDQIEQSWYWIDLANGLRNLNRAESLPYLLRCAEQAGEQPLVQFFAAETICFLGFAGYLQQPETNLGRAALRVLRLALEGLRFGVPPQVVIESRLGELVEGLWDNRPRQAHPLVVRVFHEALRQVRRAPDQRKVLSEEGGEKEAFDWQISHLTALECSLSEYLEEAAGPLCQALLTAPGPLQRDLLLALIDLRAEAAASVLPLLDRTYFIHDELAVELLTWSREKRVGPWLRTWVLRHLSPIRRAQSRPRSEPPRGSSVPVDLPYQTLLRALRGHPSLETERFLLLAGRDWDPTYRAAALRSLGWWEPFLTQETREGLQRGRRDPNAEVRQAARAALARLGERQALQFFRQALDASQPQRVHETLQLIAQEGLYLLWPDVDQLADSEDTDLAHHSREILERLSEELDKPQP